jgi:hypothetical protein
LSVSSKDWAKGFDTPEPDVYLKTHLVVFEGFVGKFREAEKEKPSLMSAIKAGEEKSRREFGNIQPQEKSSQIKKSGEEL